MVIMDRMAATASSDLTALSLLKQKATLASALKANLSSTVVPDMVPATVLVVAGAGIAADKLACWPLLP
jgi:hypothetical protein